MITAFLFFVNIWVYIKSGLKPFLRLKPSISLIEVYESPAGIFFITPLFPLEPFAPNEIYRVFFKKYQGEVAEEKSILENSFKQNKLFWIIFIMLLISLTGNFLDPYISTGTNFYTFFIYPFPDLKFI